MSSTTRSPSNPSVCGAFLWTMQSTKCAPSTPSASATPSFGAHMDEKEVRPASLEAQDDGLLDLEKEIAEVGGRNGRAFGGLENKASVRWRRDHAKPQDGVSRALPRECREVRLERGTCRRIATEDLDGLPGDEEAEDWFSQSSHRTCRISGSS